MVQWRRHSVEKKGLPVPTKPISSPALPLAEAKRAARAAAKARWASLSPAALDAISAGLCARLFALPAWRQAAGVFCFASMPGEPDTFPVLRRALAEGKLLYLPRVVGGGVMELVAVRDLGTLAPGALHIPEPTGSAPASPAALAAAGTLALLPGLAAAATPAGITRLGRGGGYYDRFLAAFAGPSIQLCPEALLFPALPSGPLDARPGALLTECRFFAPAPA